MMKTGDLLKNNNHFLWQFKKRVESGFSSKKSSFSFLPVDMNGYILRLLV